MLKAHAYLSRDKTLQCHLTPKDIPALLQQDQTLVWVDIEQPEDTEIELLLETFHLHPLTVEDCIMPNSRPKLEVFDQYLFLVLHGVGYRDGDGRLTPLELDVCLGKNFLLTMHSEGLKGIEVIDDRVQKKSPLIMRGPDFLLYGIMDALLDTYLPILDEINTQVDHLESRLLEAQTKSLLTELFNIQHALMLLRRVIAPQREVINQLGRGEFALIQPSTHVYLRDIYDRLLRVNDMLDASREIITIALEAHATLSSNRLNEAIKALTVLATIPVPFLIVASVYGMNFKYMPELEWRFGYPIVMGATLLLSMGLWWYYKRRRWF